MTYLRAGLYLLPALAAGIISNIFLLPSIERLWLESQLYSSRAWWVMQTSKTVFYNGYLIVLFCAGWAIGLELFWKRWSYYRQFAVGGVVIVMNTVVMVALLAETTAAILALDVLTKK